MFLIALVGMLSSGTADSISFDRVDLISEDRGVWLNYESPAFLSYPTRGTLRWATQIKLVWRLPKPQLFVGGSLAAQSLVYEDSLPSSTRFFWSGGIQTKYLCPNGVTMGLAWRKHRIRIGGGISILSESTWARLAYRSWHILPTLGFGIGRMYEGGRAE